MLNFYDKHDRLVYLRRRGGRIAEDDWELARDVLRLCDPLQEDHHTMMVRAITCGGKMKFSNGMLSRVSVNENTAKTLEIPR